MESYNNLTDTELLYQINESKKWHEAIKNETIELTLQIEEIEKTVNEKLKELEIIEHKYVGLIKEMTSRE